MSISQRAIAAAEMSPADKAQHRGATRLVTEDEVGDALRWLANSAREIGEARADMIRTERLLQHTEAIMMLMSEERSADARKAEARASDKWREAAEAEAVAAGEFEKLKALREAAVLRVEAWRSEAASLRAGVR